MEYRNLNDSQLVELLKLRMYNVRQKLPTFKTAEVSCKDIEDGEFTVSYIIKYDEWADEEVHVDFTKLYPNEFEYLKKNYQEVNVDFTKLLYTNHFELPLLGWINVGDKLPNEGFEVLLFNKKWINEDFNPKGIRIGFLNGTGEWVTAYYCSQHDEYHTRDNESDDDHYKQNLAEDQKPTYWFELPNTMNLK